MPRPSHSSRCDHPNSTECLSEKLEVSLFFAHLAKLRNTTITFVMSPCLSVCPHVITRLSLEKNLWNVLFEDFSKIFWENSDFIKIWQEYRALYMKTYVYIPEFFLKLESLRAKIVEKIKKQTFWTQ
jgi:hypothetical protein